MEGLTLFISGISLAIILLVGIRLGTYFDQIEAILNRHERTNKEYFKATIEKVIQNNLKADKITNELRGLSEATKVKDPREND